jgi:aerobic carbon-monoxide dehydrogenase large subunit
VFQKLGISSRAELIRHGVVKGPMKRTPPWPFPDPAAAFEGEGLSCDGIGAMTVTERTTWDTPFRSGGWKPSYIGVPAPRLEDDRLLTGRGRYVADIRLPGMVDAAFTRSRIAHGRILGIETEAASDSPGVLAVVTAGDLDDVSPVPHFYELAKPVGIFPLCRDRVRYIGAPVAAVVAEDRYRAEDGAERVEARIEPLPVIATIDDALDPSSARLYPAWPSNKLVEVTGATHNADAAFETLRCVGGSYTVQRQAPMPIETRGVVAEFSDGRLTVWSCTQFPHFLRTMLSHVLGFAERSIRVIAPDIGGGFGGKAEIYPEEYVVPWLACRLRRPVRWIEDRSEHMIAACHGRDVRIDIEAAVHEDGTIEAVRGQVLHDVGSGEIYPGGFSPSLIAVGILTGPYRIPQQRFDVTCVVTNKTPSGAYRGFGQPEAVFAMERLLDKVARELELDRIDLRRRLIIDSEELPFITASGARIDSGSHREAFERGADFASTRTAVARQRLGDRSDLCIGVGVANFLEGVAANFHLTSGLWTAQDSCDIRFDPDGGVNVGVGVSTAGQGLQSMVATVAADALGLPINRIRVVMGDTDLSPYGLGGWASRSTVVTCGAIHRAATELRDKGIRIAAHLLDAPAEGIRIEDDRFFSEDNPDVSVSWGDVALVALIRVFELPADVEPGLEARATYLPPHIDWSPDEFGKVNACPTYTNSTHVAVVAVDIGTGAIGVVDYGIFHDCGRVINPLIVAGQLHGGVAQGIAGALFEELPYDGNAEPQATTLMTYLIPTALDIPSFHLEELETLTREIPFGVKGVGEAGVIGPAAAIASAIEDALADFLPSEITRTPVTPPDVLRMTAEWAAG